MQRNKSNEIARDIIRTAKEIFNEKINNITLFICVGDRELKQFRYGGSM